MGGADVSCERGKRRGEARGWPQARGCLFIDELLWRTDKARSLPRNILVCILELDGHRRWGCLEISPSLCLHQRLDGWRVQDALGDGHSNTRAKSAPEVAKLVLRQVLARPPLCLVR